MGIKNLSIRIDETMLHKLHFVADYEGQHPHSGLHPEIRKGTWRNPHQINAYQKTKRLKSLSSQRIPAFFVSQPES